MNYFNFKGEVFVLLYSVWNNDVFLFKILFGFISMFFIYNIFIYI